jgi:tetratricopeptide (TPR) repeat protein
MAEGAKGVDRIEYLQRANEALLDALEIRKELNGDTNDKESLLIAINMASVKRIEGKLTESESILLSTLTAANQLWGEINVVTSTIYNNLAICVKLQSRFAEAESFYNKALNARRKIYGEDHNEVIVVMYNLAELYLAQGREEDSKKIQQDVLALLEKRQGGSGETLLGKHSLHYLC